MCGVLRHLDQRFPTQEEAAFKKDVQPKVAQAGVVSSTLFLLVLCASTLSVANDLNHPDLPLQFAPNDPRTWATATKIVLACLGIVNLAMFSLHLRVGWLAWWNWELQMLSMATLAMVFNAFNSSRWALFWGLQPEDVYTYDTAGDDCFEMLSLDAMTTGLCIFVPIRSCILWVAPVSGLFVHVAMRVAFSPVSSSTWLDPIVLSILAFLSLVGAFSNERTARERFQAVRNVKVQEELLSNQYAAMSRILARFCDCLLELDADFRFCGPHQHFAAIVFSSANKSLHGGSFLDHLASGQQGFAEMLSKNTPLDHVSDMLPLLLKDSQGREFAAQAYCTCYEDRKGRHYLVGITETQERMPQEAFLAPLLDFSPVKSSVRRSSNPSLGESSADVVEEPQEIIENISFTFLDDEDFSIVSCSPGFTALGGPLSQEQPMKRWMRPHEQQRFSNWVQELGNMFRRYQACKDVVLCPPHTEQAEVEYVVELSLSFLQMTDDSELAFEVSVEQIRQRKRCRKKRKLNYKTKHGPLAGAMHLETDHPPVEYHSVKL